MSSDTLNHIPVRGPDARKYVLLRGLEHNNRFISMSNGESDDELVRTADGRVAYAIIGFAPTMREAQLNLYGHSTTELKD